ncbi:MAG TPA: hypothetical protein VGM58_06100, partial [Verrucomicrobiae bacterium]
MNKANDKIPSRTFTGLPVKFSAMQALHKIAPLAATIQQETDVEHEAKKILLRLGFIVKTRKCGVQNIDENWPSVTSPKSKIKRAGKPDFLLCLQGEKIPFCVWDNKARNETAVEGLTQSKQYISGLHAKLRTQPNLPRVAVGFNGSELLMEYFAGRGANPWIPLKAQGQIVKDCFPVEALVRNGISARGIITSASGGATVHDLRKALWALKTRYRV